ncbi:TonB-dependent receptor [Draconibacterium sp. IB214405]|uniref:TonB-dependent receptor n=1 Tax=Draconibacterium sp. IB214405 TaxID=3097352 RepID=UPI002A112FE5|nr:TonB-dependent receptor [Draconibacterium sp. IB214405]MDX8340665.1 TonB-dependent receptor [Draconibacterium sp. IB214405]
MKKFSLMLLLQVMAVIAFGQINLTGLVKGDGEALAGASVVIEKSFYGVSTHANGSFEFKNLKPGDYTLLVSFIGFEPQKINLQLSASKNIEVNLQPNVIMTDEVLISATRAGNKTPVAYSNVSSDEIAKRNMGQDIPFLLNLTPSFVTTSDAGAGVGYTNFRVRGTDLNRINVSVNGIPLNDAESHGTWFVDQPDMASSLENVQIQRGVGTSTNGAAAFGASINLQTNALNKEAYGSYKTAAGTFNTFKNTISAGTGLMNDHFTVDVRLSKVTSDGFVDRASSDLKSFFVSGGYYSENTIIKVNVFTGYEETYQAWYGVPTVRLNDDMAGMQQYADHWLMTQEEVDHMMASDSRTYNYYTYKNQVDHYVQDHYQLHFSHKFNSNLNLNASLHYTYGTGYYENYKADEDLADYQLPNIEIGGAIIETTDLINRKWLDNDFYGFTYSFNYNKNNSDFTFGGGYNVYDGRHFGNVIWAQYLGEAEYDHEWYRGTGLKKDFNVFAKYNWQVAEKLNLFADMQYRRIDYTIEGIDDDLRVLDQDHDFNFFNPKLGIFYQVADNQDLYLSFAVANREPNRTAFVDYPAGNEPPVHETLHDWELGYNYASSKLSFGANAYFMNYKDQLVVTGQINDVGSAIMVNVDESYRAGIELQAGVQIANDFQWNGNTTLSINKIKDFTEYVDNWDTWGQDAFDLGNTDLAFSPNVVANSQFVYSPGKHFSIAFISQYVGDQYIDNTSSDDRKIDAYFVNHLKADYTFTTKLFDEISLHFMANNLLDVEYESNAWVYPYLLGGERYKMDGYYPQAGAHFMFGVDFTF